MSDVGEGLRKQAGFARGPLRRRMIDAADYIKELEAKVAHCGELLARSEAEIARLKENPPGTGPSPEGFFHFPAQE